ncbi:hypothetical protein ACRALDRAFT_2021140 [Sodiomyces alcalophilus JCM 7366]|uniref:uncharacterized protein n=1 Tax=Sodiomyces alcalophilus JCM 7366 TaxID=591952 RepID=UPI0039B55D5E
MRNRYLAYNGMYILYIDTWHIHMYGRQDRREQLFKALVYPTKLRRWVCSVLSAAPVTSCFPGSGRLQDGRVETVGVNVHATLGTQQAYPRRSDESFTLVDVPLGHFLVSFVLSSMLVLEIALRTMAYDGMEGKGNRPCTEYLYYLRTCNAHSMYLQRIHILCYSSHIMTEPGFAGNALYVNLMHPPPP